MRDEVTAVTIYALDETEYVVTARPMVRRLLKYVDEEIEAHGVLTQDEYGSDVFMVSDFAPLDVAEEGSGKEGDWEEDDGLVEEEDWEDEEEPEEGSEEDWDKGDGDDAGPGWKGRRRR
jgi:hypothetical protein